MYDLLFSESLLIVRLNVTRYCKLCLSYKKKSKNNILNVAKLLRNDKFARNFTFFSEFLLLRFNMSRYDQICISYSKRDAKDSNNIVQFG